MDEQMETEEHFGVGKEYEFIDEKLVIVPLGVMYYGDSLKIVNKLQNKFKGKVPTGQEVFNAIAVDDDLMGSISRMVAKTLDNTIGDRTQDEINSFAMKNMIYLFNAVIEQNSPRMNKADMTKAQKIAARQKFHDESVSKNKKQ